MSEIQINVLLKGQGGSDALS